MKALRIPANWQLYKEDIIFYYDLGPLLVIRAGPVFTFSGVSQFSVQLGKGSVP